MMPRIKTDEPEFNKLLDDFNSINETLIIKDRDINLRNTVNIDVFNKSYKFENCIIKGGRIDFFDFHFKDESKQNFYSVEFKNCEISSDLFVKDCKLHTLSFTNVKVDANHFHISSSEILYIRFNSQASKRTEIKNLYLHQLNYEKTIIDFSFNIIQNLNIENCSVRKFFGINNHILKGFLNRFTTSEEFIFNKSSIEQVFEVKKTELSKTNFYQSSLPRICDFKNVVFREITNFDHLLSKNANLNFETCVFENIANFDYSKFGQLKFVGTIFKDICTFNNVEFNSNFILVNTHFEKNAFFGKLLELNSVKLFDLNTLRTIKAQLLKADNKIDYNRVNAYEQRKYFQELTFKNPDFFILLLNRMSNDFGISWLKGIWFTLKCSFLFFVALLIVNNFVESNYPLSINPTHNWAKFEQILSEFLKFIFSFGFTSPGFQSNGFLFLIFIIAKIFIGFGIYQTIAAFRKFK